MGLFLRQDGGQSELQSKVAADLKERLKDRAAIPESEHESTLLEGQHETRPAGMIIILLVAAGIVMVGAWILYSNGAF